MKSTEYLLTTAFCCFTLISKGARVNSHAGLK